MILAMGELSVTVTATFHTARTTIVDAAAHPGLSSQMVSQLRRPATS
jgi:hypothetical protein